MALRHGRFKLKVNYECRRIRCHPFEHSLRMSPSALLLRGQPGPVRSVSPARTNRCIRIRNDGRIGTWNYGCIRWRHNRRIGIGNNRCIGIRNDRSIRARLNGRTEIRIHRRRWIRIGSRGWIRIRCRRGIRVASRPARRSGRNSRGRGASGTIVWRLSVSIPRKGRENQGAEKKNPHGFHVR